MESPLFIRILIVLALLGIVASLGVALLQLIRDRGRSTRTVKALTLRIGLSIALFVLLVAGFLTGVVVPHGVVP